MPGTGWRRRPTGSPRSPAASGRNWSPIKAVGISRLLGNALIEVDAVMAPYAREVLARLAADGRTVVLMIDQTRATERHQVVMVAARVGGRALPLAWRGKGTGGAGGGPPARRGGGGGGPRFSPGGAGG